MRHCVFTGGGFGRRSGRGTGGLDGCGVRRAASCATRQSRACSRRAHVAEGDQSNPIDRFFFLHLICGEGQNAAQQAEMQAAGKQPAFPGAARTARSGGRERKRRVSRARNRRGCLMSVPDWGQTVPADLCRLDFPVFHTVFPRFLGESRMAASRKAAAVSTMAAPGGTEKWKENQSPAAEAAAPSRAARMNMRRRL